MQALGLIETRGLTVAIESADAMLKAAEVTLIEKTYVGGGLVSIAVTGEVSAVIAAVEAGAGAVRQINSAMLISQHVIPRPDKELEGLIVSVNPLENSDLPISDSIKVEPEEEAVVGDLIVEEKNTISLEMSVEEIEKKTIDYIVLEYGLQEALEYLGSLKVSKLRNLAREYQEIGIAGREISKADKKKLLAELTQYYNHFNNKLHD
ncbi:BMC domain-containing protein [Neobacillus sp. WH10]|uniref:BMC domain-containing protein n=1 Tax=Neobacillus sp. WH10 TaxID=3047873 RepID=UPI0024C1A9C8|nr:BMC domain-containing protein [Neobacillus sp. WH10]WHY79529.1 BMC domain-containing protein [Neobacillus sp. WH10]